MIKEKKNKRSIWNSLGELKTKKCFHLKFLESSLVEELIPLP